MSTIIIIIIIKNELFDNFTVQHKMMMLWLNLPQHIMAQLTPMSSIQKQTVSYCNMRIVIHKRYAK